MEEDESTTTQLRFFRLRLEQEIDGFRRLDGQAAEQVPAARGAESPKRSPASQRQETRVMPCRWAGVGPHGTDMPSATSLFVPQTPTQFGGGFGQAIWATDPPGAVAVDPPKLPMHFSACGTALLKPVMSHRSSSRTARQNRAKWPVVVDVGRLSKNH